MIIQNNQRTLHVNYRDKKYHYDICITNDISQIQYNNFQYQGIELNFIFASDFSNKKLDLNLRSLNKCEELRLVFDLKKIYCSEIITNAFVVIYNTGKDYRGIIDIINIKPFKFNNKPIRESVCKKTDGIIKRSTYLAEMYGKFVLEPTLLYYTNKTLNICIENRFKLFCAVVLIGTMIIAFYNQS